MSADDESTRDEAPAVALRGIHKSFNGVPVLRGVDFEVAPCEVHALAGENGAGKSTLMKILQGVHLPDSGEIQLRGRQQQFSSTKDARAAGVGMVFQEFSLVPTLTVAQNIFLNYEPRRCGLIDDREAVQRARALLADMGVDLDPAAEVGSLSTGAWQLTEIAKALAQQARVLIMDEPTASLAKDEVDALFALISRLTERGISIIYISHRMEEVYRIADRITVLRDGTRVLTERLSLLSPEQIVEAIVGRTMENALQWQPRAVDRTSAPLLEARNLRSETGVSDVSLEVHRGEIVGLAGLMGSGRTEVARCLFGVDKLESGEILLHGRRRGITSPTSAIDQGIAMVPEDRRLQGLVLDHTIRDNLLLPLLDGLRRGPFVDDGRGASTVATLVDKLQIRAASVNKPVRLLSGGNQQKVVIAKWLATDPDLLILDEPTAGVDVGTKQEIIELIRGLADDGKGIIVISSELPELLAISDRVLVLRHGTVAADLDRAGIADEESLQLAIQGV